MKGLREAQRSEHLYRFTPVVAAAIQFGYELHLSGKLFLALRGKSCSLSQVLL